MTKIQKIDEEYTVENILYNGEQVWPYLRMVYGFKLVFTPSQNDIKLNVSKHMFGRFLQTIFSLFYGFRNWFKSYDYIVYGNTDGKKLLDGLYEDRLAEPLMNKLGDENVLFIEQLNKKKFYPFSKLHHKNTVSYSVVELLAGLISRLLFLRKFESTILDQINKDFAIRLNYEVRLKQFFLSTQINILIFKLYRPKIVFITNYAQKTVIKAAKSLGIPVVEIQHGVINEQHHGYNMKNPIDYSYYPDYILTTGEKEKQFFISDSAYIENTQHIFPVGSYYIDWINQNFDSQRIRNKFTDFKQFVSVSLQWTVAEEMIDFIEKAAPNSPNTLFILIPRIPEDLNSFYKKSDNIIVLNRFNCYEIVKGTDFHITSYSSCGYEAPSLDTQNIFVDFGHPSQLGFSDFIDAHTYNYKVSSAEELTQVLKNPYVFEEDEVRHENSQNIAVDYQNNVSKFLDFLNIELSG